MKLDSDGWRVALVSISTTESRVDLGDIFGNHPLFQEITRGQWSSSTGFWATTFNKDMWQITLSRQAKLSCRA